MSHRLNNLILKFLMTLQTDIVTAARGWLGTRFAHQGRVKATAQHKGGCDCLGLLVGVAKELGLRRREGTALRALSDYDRTDYGHIPDGARLQFLLEEALVPVTVQEVEPGDILLFRFDGNPQHLAIVSDYPQGLGIIHAYAEARKVIEHRLDEAWRGRIVRAYRFAVA